MSTPVGDFTQINVGPQPVQICPPLGQGITVTLYNADINNIVTVARNNSISQNASNGAPIQPLTSAVMDASKALYGVAPAGTAALVVLPQGGTLSPSPAQIAAQISALGLAKETTQLAQSTTIPNGISVTGVPLLTKSSALGNGTGLALAGSASVTLLNAVNISQIGYEFSLTSVQSSAAAIFPLLKVTMLWKDSVTGQTTAIDIFYTSAFSQGAANLVTVGTGTSKGDTLTVTLSNTTATPITYSWVAAQNSRVYTRDDWRWLGYQGIAGAGQFSQVANPAFSETESGILVADTAAGVLAGTTVTKLIPLYCGSVWIHADETGVGPSNVTYQILTQTAFGTQAIWSSQVGGGPNGTIPNGPLNQLIALPRSPCIFSMSNAGSVNANFNTKIVIAEQAA